MSEEMTDQEIIAEMRSIRRSIQSIARTFRFMTDEQLEPYCKMADRYDELEKQLKEDADAHV